jgi:opacity protein-like surface antigen
MLLNALRLLAAAICFIAQPAQAGDFISNVPVESWTGFSVGIGGGVGFLSADTRASGSRTDTFGACELASPSSCGGQSLDLREIDQRFSSSSNDNGDAGGFFTVQAAYDYQFAPRLVAGGFIDADWSDLSANSDQSSLASLTFFCPQGFCGNDGPIGTFNPSQGNIQTKISTDWIMSVGGRVGWLANPGTLLYFLAGYTHVELSDAQVRVNIPDPSNLVDVIVARAPGSGIFPNSPTELLVRLPESLDGFSLGGGGEAKIGGPWTLKLEYRWTHLDGGSDRAASKDQQCCAEGFDGGSGLFRKISSDASADFHLDVQTVRGELVYHFWSGSEAHGG